MQSQPYSCRSMCARASPWGRVLRALAIAAVGALLMFASAHAVHATAVPHPAAVSHAVAIAIDVPASLDAPAVGASAPDCETDHTRRSTPEIRSDGDAASPFPDVVESEPDDDDDDLHRALASAPSQLSARLPLDQFRCLLEDAGPDCETPSAFLTESVRRM